MAGTIDIVCNLYTPEEVRNGQTGLDDSFKTQVRMSPEMREGVPIDAYLHKMDKAGIARSLLIAVRCGDMAVRGSFEIPYARVAEVCSAHPTRFSGLAGVDPFRGMQGLRDLEAGVRAHGFVGAHLYPHWFGLAPDDAKYYPYYAKCCELDIPIMMQVGQNLVYSRERRLPSVARADHAGQGRDRLPGAEAAGDPYRRALGRGDDRHGLEARERLHRRGCLRAEALAEIAGEIPGQLRAGEGAVRHRLAGDRPRAGGPGKSMS